MAPSVLIVHADAAESRRLTDIVSRLGLNVSTAARPAAILAQPQEAMLDLIILDLEAPGFDRREGLRQLRETLRTPVIALARGDGFGVAEAALAAGASDVIVKPGTVERIEIAVRNALKISALEEEIARISRTRGGFPNFSDLVAVSPEMQRAVMLARRAADLDLPVLVEGEPGTGKELTARAIGAACQAAGGPFIVLRCGGSSEPLEDGAGHDDGDAVNTAWADAAGGVLFIDEIAELPQAGQFALAERLSEQSLAQSGTKGMVRLICTSSKNLIDRVTRGQFREDLYYRINVFPIWLPPLRDRPDDIPALSAHFLGQIIAEEGRSIGEIDEAALALLKAYVWPGNVRQLENAIFRAVALADTNRLTAQEFPQIAAQVPGFRNGGARSSPALPSPFQPHYEGPAMVGANLPTIRQIALAPAQANVALGIPALTEQGEIRRLEDIEADLIRLALGHYRGHITEVARRLGIGRSTLYRKMREFGLAPRHN
jgi:DNA-binding NtrC family response regulator